MTPPPKIVARRAPKIFDLKEDEQDDEDVGDGNRMADRRMEDDGMWF